MEIIHRNDAAVIVEPVPALQAHDVRGYPALGSTVPAFAPAVGASELLCEHDALLQVDGSFIRGLFFGVALAFPLWVCVAYLVKWSFF